VKIQLALFADCRLDGLAHTLERAGEAVHLTPKAFALLEMLLEQRPAVLTKDQIMERLWPGVFVSEANISNLIAEIREAIGDRAERSRLVRTVHRVGYSFSGEAHVVFEGTSPGYADPGVRGLVLGEPGLDRGGGARDRPDRPPEPRKCGAVACSFCCLVVDGHEHVLCDGDNVIGRSEACQVPVSSSTVSRRHARVRVGAGLAVLQDLGSKNGTYLRGRLVESAVRLRDGDEIRLGEVLLCFRLLDRARPTQTYVAIDIDGAQLPTTAARSAFRPSRKTAAPGISDDT
jgi:DNA-binding winged helix-turn-helix (wHTH) protein